MMIEEICKKARAEGLTYGQYVAKHKAELAGMQAEPKKYAGVRYCKKCGRKFEPTSDRHVFCRQACRVGYNQKKRREKGTDHG